jgi:hypothetical protein
VRIERIGDECARIPSGGPVREIDDRGGVALPVRGRHDGARTSRGRVTMRLPSIDQAATSARDTAVRFPFVLAIAVVAAIAGLMLVQESSNDDVVRMLFAALLGLPLLFALATAAERRDLAPGFRTAIQAGALVALFVYLILSLGWTETHAITRFFHLALAFHLLVAFLPFSRAGSLQGFWQFNRILFLRFLLAALYVAVLFAGLSLALLALDNLLGVNVRGRAYGRLFVLLALIFHPWFFLAGIPRDLAALDRRTDYPNGLKIFSQFVLVPLASVYLMILTAYLVRIIVTSTWPSGWIGWLVSGVAAAGTLAILLVHPIREREDARWVDVYGRWFYVGLVPSIAMLLMAIGQRIGQYGITERRYFLLVLAVWLTGVALYYGITGSRNIRVIPATLCFVALATLAGPWSAYSVARASQVARFETMLGRNGMRQGDAIVRPAAEVSFEDRRELSAIVRYLVQTHGPESLARIDPALADAARGPAPGEPGQPAGTTDAPAAERALHSIGIDYLTRYEGRAPEAAPSFHVQAVQGPDAIDISGYDLLVRADLTQRVAIPLRGDTLSLHRSPNGVIVLEWLGTSVEAGSVRTLAERIGALPPSDPAAPAPPVRGMPGMVPIADLVLDAEIGELRVRILFHQLGGQLNPDGLNIYTAIADVLVGGR